ncbi:hypothetical protein BLS_001387 [Venturia inaequalis]|uniref:NAD(P)-binding protein n=1 Tax=Venturia inaequalis TaxID=5025 RepID=A0A8H3VHR9_VENIN|nr:hypothetical protein EG327_010725 [Venturia inaequalis]KAE9977484.1 hypothetical protein BLS_001387 [Venturia inaequalis]KAE9987228.1 hypothetical protein EG328_003361 [Venturia inaequalis]RDI85157.1 hypothetical protein Vi05172_g4686 [Venturia inaequalis]
MTSTFTVDPSSLSNLRNKFVLITGGSSGIGLATAALIASLDSSNKIAILDRAPPPSSFNIPFENLFFGRCDVTDWKTQRTAFEGAIAKFGRLDAVFVNAGIAEYKDQFFTDDLDSEGKLAAPDHRVLDIDINAATDTVKLAIFYLRKNGGGSIIMTASLAGYLASAGAPNYSAAKHGIVGLMRALKQETAKLNIAISIIAPGITLTPILKENREGETESLDEWAAKMRKAGVPINKAESIALSVAHLINSGIEANGMGVLIQADRMSELERGLAKSRETWMGKEMLDLFRGGRDAPLFPRMGEKSKM